MSRLSKRAARRAKARAVTYRSDEISTWLPMIDAPEDNSVIYHYKGSKEYLGVIDFCSPQCVWVQDLHTYFPRDSFDGWRKVMPDQIINVVRPQYKRPPWGPATSVFE